MIPIIPLVLVLLLSAANAQQITQVGNTLVSAMMMFLGNDEKVYILDKVENNPTTIAGHPAWGSVWDIASQSATPMDVFTNTFCAAGMHLANGSWIVFGGNSAVGPNGVSDQNQNAADPTYGDYDGRTIIRMIQPCTGSSNSFGAQCQWLDSGAALAMQTQRWYPGTEALADGSVIIVGGATNGGYVNRNTPETDPLYENGLANPTYEYFPSRGAPAVLQFLGKTSGLNMYAHMYLMPSGKLFVQAKLSTMLWDHENNIENDLPDMPNGVVRVYPASGGSAMLPLTPSNNWTPTILFCGGSTLPDADYGNYGGPHFDTWTYMASDDCQRITPEPLDTSQNVTYEQDDSMLDPRTMGQLIILPTGKLLLLNGGRFGTAGYAPTGTPDTPVDQLPYGLSLAADPVLTPAIYDPNAPAGQRWSNASMPTSQIPRMYHSGALLLPDGSVMVAGSNPNVDYNGNTFFSTEYRAEYFYPSYWAQSRPNISGIPPNLTYGGEAFDLVVAANSYSGDANSAAGNTSVVLIRPGFSTHAMNMGQRYVQLNNTFTVAETGDITLHVAQVPPNPNLLTPGPVLVFVVVNGIPSVAQMVTVGSGQTGQQQTLPVSDLPPPVLASAASAGDGGASTSIKSSGGPSLGVIVGSIVGGVAVFAAIGVGMVFWARNRTRTRQTTAPSFRTPSYKAPVPVKYRDDSPVPSAAFQRPESGTPFMAAGLPYAKDSANSSGMWSPDNERDMGYYSGMTSENQSDAALTNARGNLDQMSPRSIYPPPGYRGAPVDRRGYMPASRNASDAEFDPYSPSTTNGVVSPLMHPYANAS